MALLNFAPAKKEQMRNIYWFNPENDLAIASGAENYCPPPSARAIASDLSLLPIWYADPKSVVLTPLGVAEDWNVSIRRQLGITATWSDTRSFTIDPTDRLIPWGWSLAMVKQFKRLNALPDQYPLATQLESLRNISHKRTSIAILEHLDRDYNLFSLPEYPRLLTLAIEVEQYIEQRHPILLKAPWSNSGKGILWERNGYDTHTQKWSNGVLKYQGALIGERVYPKIADFAMEFFSDGIGKVTFAGYSWFETNDKGVYQQNKLLPDAEIEKSIQILLPTYPLTHLKRALEQILTNLVGSLYRGYLGIDMLIWKEGCHQYQLHPCIELNLRNNMGMVSRILYDRYVAVGKEGYYFIHYAKSSEELTRFCDGLAESHPLVIQNHRIDRGYLPLTPLLESTIYHAGIIIL